MFSFLGTDHYQKTRANFILLLAIIVIILFLIKGNPMSINPEETLVSNNLIVSVFYSLNDSPSLFDFNTPVTEDVYVAAGPTQIFRKREGDHTLRRTKVVSKRQAMNGEVPAYDYEPLFNLTSPKHPGSTYQLTASKPSSFAYLDHPDALSSLPFICLSNQGRIHELASHRIVKDDVVRLGRTVFRVLETHLTLNSSSNLPAAFSQSAAFEIAHLDGRACRICLAEGGDDLIAPCACRGTCEWVHFSCLQTWIQSKVRREQNQLVCLYSLARLECQLCKQPLPNRIQIAKKHQLLVGFQWPAVPFILLEKMPLDNERGRTFVMLTPRHRQVRIGRGPTNEVRIQDYTISRIHASIRQEDGVFWLKDEGSKFGSLIMLRGKVDIGSIMCIQAGSKLYKVYPYQNRPLVHPIMFA